jgi:hypothetical protein
MLLESLIAIAGAMLRIVAGLLADVGRPFPRLRTWRCRTFLEAGLHVPGEDARMIGLLFGRHLAIERPIARAASPPHLAGLAGRGDVDEGCAVAQRRGSGTAPRRGENPG